MSRLRSAVARRLAAHPRVRRVTLAAADTVLRVATVPPPGLKAGPSRPGPTADRWPLVVVLLTGQDDEGCGALVDALGDLSRRVGGCRFLPVLAARSLPLARRASWPAEQLVDLATWSRRRPGTPYEEHLREREETTLRDYAATLAVRVDVEEEHEKALGVVEEAARRAVRTFRPTRWDRVVMRARRVVDASS